LTDDSKSRNPAGEDVLPEPGITLVTVDRSASDQFSTRIEMTSAGTIF
jgi:hypothetical protein